MISVTIKIKASATRVWQALTEINQMKEWYFDIQDFDLNEGSVFNFYETGGTNQFHHRCKMLKIVPEKLLSHTWTHPSHSKGESVVTWNIVENQEFTEVTLQHDGLENFNDAGPDFAPENYQFGWEGLLMMLKNYLHGLQKQIFSIQIDALPEKIWKVLFEDNTYRKWASVFCEGTYFEGALVQGECVHFLTPDGNGMYSNVVYCMENQHVIFQHIGEIVNFVEQPLDAETEQWSGSFEQYQLVYDGKMTTLTAEVDLTPEHVSYFKEQFPKGLEIIKKLSEN